MSNAYDRAVDALNELSHRLADVDTEQLRLHRDNKRLLAENATLRTQLADVTESMGRVEERCANLRGLAERAWKSAERLCQAFDRPCSDDGVTTCKPCPMGARDEECVYGQLQRELRELGIEVDG